MDKSDQVQADYARLIKQVEESALGSEFVVTIPRGFTTKDQDDRSLERRRESEQFGKFVLDVENAARDRPLDNR